MHLSNVCITKQNEQNSDKDGKEKRLEKAAKIGKILLNASQESTRKKFEMKLSEEQKSIERSDRII